MIELSLYRLPARGARIGTLVVNPGGPGASGLQYLQDAGNPFPPGFDVITFDPRGVGRSHPVDCVTDDDLDAWYGSANNPRDDAELEQWLERDATVAARCDATDLGSTIGTVDVARDIDQIRRAIGDEQISYLGFSYGSRLGWTYAALYPERVRAMVLDAPEDPVADWEQSAIQQAEAQEQLLDAFVAWCATGVATTCPADPRAAVIEVIREADRSPIRTDHPETPLSGAYALNAVLTAFYDEATWPDLGRALRDAQAGDGTRLIELSFLWHDRRNHDPYVSIDAQTMIWCADHPARPTVGEVDRLREVVARSSPVFSEWVPGAVPPCSSRRVDDDVVATPRWAGATPILVVTSTDDVATPRVGADHLVEALGRAELLVRDGAGHTSYLRGDECVDAAVEQYLVDLVVPAAPACA